jgi:DNA (cytosine-5)-methyltransferase 1
MVQEKYNINEVSNLLDISIPRLISWQLKGKLVPEFENGSEEKLYSKKQLKQFEIANQVFSSKWNEEINIKPKRSYNSIELFAGAGGMALGFEKAGVHHLLLNEIDKHACETLRINRPDWNVVEGAVENIDFQKYRDKVDIVTGGFPCQAFSYAGKKRGFNDARGTLFYEFARCIDEVRPKVFVGENVRGLFHHDNGKTLKTMKAIIKDLGYTLIDPRVLKAMYYKVPQKRERLFLIGFRNDISSNIDQFKFPSPYSKVLTVSDAFTKGELYDKDVPDSLGVNYPKRKHEIMSLVPEGGNWKNLSEDLQREYMNGSFYLGGGKTGLARRLSMSAPSLTIVCSPAMKQTERCHPIETRPLTVRESARIQTFPDNWEFAGSKHAAYKQIGNAVPVNLAWAIARSVVAFLNKIKTID